MKKKCIRSLLVAALATSAVIGCAACGKTSVTNGDSQSNISAKNTKPQDTEDTISGGSVRTVVFQTADSYAPTAYLDIDGNPAGYEVEVFQAVADLLPQYEFVIEAVSNENLDNNLISRKADVVGFKQTIEEAALNNFAFGAEQYDTIVERVFVLAENADLYHEWEDFAGKTVYAFASSESKDEYPLNEYNEEHPDNPINVEYVSDPATCVNDLVTGKADGFTRSQPSVISYSERFGVQLATAKTEATDIDGIYYKYRKDEDAQLIADIDAALKTLKENGTINEIHNRLFYGTDWDFEGNISEWVEEHPEYLTESEY